MIQFIPKWSNFVKDVVDSEDLPLNISRETQQMNKILRVITKSHANECLDMFAEIAELNDDRKKFYELLVKCMKLGIHENSVDGFETAELLRFHTSKSGGEQISFEEYVDRMTEEQNDIYYITARVLPWCPRRHSLKICARKIMRYPTWLTPWMKMPCTSPRTSTERSRMTTTILSCLRKSCQVQV